MSQSDLCITVQGLLDSLSRLSVLPSVRPIVLTLADFSTAAAAVPAAADCFQQDLCLVFTTSPSIRSVSTIY